jgi:DNA-binding LacI/PurR family transcriptional regulator
MLENLQMGFRDDPGSLYWNAEEALAKYPMKKRVRAEQKRAVEPAKRPSREPRIGLREIAASAGVSLATVSRVFNGNKRVDTAIRDRVLNAAGNLNVDVSQRNKSKAIAFLLCNRTMVHAFHSRVLIGAEEYCASQGWDIIFLAYNYARNVPWQQLHLPNVVQRHDVVRGAILAGTNSMNLIELLEHRNITFSLLGNNLLDRPQHFRHDEVVSDDVQGSFDMTRFLIQQGHRAIWFLGNRELPWFSRCFSGYHRAMDEAGLETRESGISSDNDAEIGYLGTKALLSSGKTVTAIFAGNDPTAHGVYKALRDSGLRIPDDISVVGCNDTVGPWVYPGLTTIREFPEQLGRQLVETLLRRISTPETPPQHVSIPTELIKRDSTRPLLPEISGALSQSNLTSMRLS